jgi:hypothetical protein
MSVSMVFDTRWFSALLVCAAALFSPIVLTAAPKQSCDHIQAEQIFEQYTAGRNALPLVLRNAFERYVETINRYPDLQAILPIEAVAKLGARLENEYLLKRLNATLEIMSADRRNWQGAAKFKAALKKSLYNNVPESQIEERIKGLDSYSEKNLMRALGYMTHEEVGLLLHGGKPTKPTKDSLIGQYVARTGAKLSVQSFGRRPKRSQETEWGGEEPRPIDPNSAHGPERLLVPVSNESMEVFKELLVRPELMMHAHGADQGTLMVGFDGQVGYYANVQRPASDPRAEGFQHQPNSELRISQDAIWPTILLSTSEAGRARMYFDIGTTAREVPAPQDPNQPHNQNHFPNYSKEPWELEGYCATGGYSSCTHWWGEAGIGDKRVKEWVFPGYVDEHAENQIYKNPKKDAQPRIQKLKKYSKPEGMPSHLENIVDQLYSFPEAGEQLAVMVGTQSQLTKGEWANPGFVAISLLGPAKQDRVPVVFVNVTDHKKALPKKFEPRIAAY